MLAIVYSLAGFVLGVLLAVLLLHCPLSPQSQSQRGAVKKVFPKKKKKMPNRKRKKKSLVTTQNSD